MKFLIVFLFATISCVAADTTWQKILLDRLPAYGHRNWVVVADSAYPAQSKDGIETVVANADQIEVLQAVMAALGKSKHITPVIYTDQELQYLDNAEAPGVEAYRRKLSALLGGRPVLVLQHERIIEKLDEVSRTFKVLVIKTNMTVPYTSVFLQLDCAYWGPDAEKGLRAKMAAAGVR